MPMLQEDLHNLAAARADFLAEAADMLHLFEAALLQLERDPRERESLDAAFRAAHTIKGNAGLFGMDALVNFTHGVESLMDALRSGAVPLLPETHTLLLASLDQMRAMLGEAEAGAHSPARQARAQALLDQLATLEHQGARASHLTERAPSTVRTWRIWLSPKPDALRRGHDPLPLIRDIARQSLRTSVVTHAHQVPALAQLNAEDALLSFELGCENTLDLAALQSTFEQARHDWDVHIQPFAPSEEPPAASATSAASRDFGGDRPEPIAPPLPNHHGHFVRVRARKLDRLIDLIGELVIAASGAQLQASRKLDPQLNEAVQRIHDLVQESREEALSLRMVPIGETFARFHRVVRDGAQALNKDIDLLVLGAETELDKGMIESLLDPIIHLVRNSMDHGIELPHERLAAGKPAHGQITLNAFHEAGSIVIEVTDDGRGLDADGIRQRAQARGLIDPGQSADDVDLLHILCQPGFSTSEGISTLSGRGVGMDVVKRNVESLRGQLLLRNAPGLGITTQMRLPLTLAIIDGFVCEAAGLPWVVPLDMVVECLDLPGEHQRNPHRHSGCFELRGTTLPYIDLSHFFDPEAPPTGRRSMLVANAGSQSIGLIVDRLVGEHQTVIKPLDGLFQRMPGVSGSTILGSGDVALILDVQAMVHQCLHPRPPESAACPIHHVPRS